LSGIEVAAELASGWPTLSVTLLTRGELGPRLSEPARRHIRRFFDEHTVKLRESSRVERLEHGVAKCAGAERVDFDLCIWAGGFRALDLAREAGLGVNSNGQVQVGADLRALSHPEVWAIGDAAAVGATTSAPLNACCKIAQPMALHAADNLARRLFGLGLQPFDFRDGGVCISLGRRDAVIDLRHPDGSVRSRVITGRMGARFKEAICRYTVARQRWERSGWWPMRALDRPALALDTSRPREITP
jgi:NADH dehydrogenase